MGELIGRTRQLIKKCAICLMAFKLQSFLLRGGYGGISLMEERKRLFVWLLKKLVMIDFAAALLSGFAYVIRKTDEAWELFSISLFCLFILLIGLGAANVFLKKQ
jgi:hypothetical protein